MIGLPTLAAHSVEETFRRNILEVPAARDSDSRSNAFMLLPHCLPTR